MKFGVLGFSYATFPHLEEMLHEHGSYTVNLGDNAQTIAARHALKCLGISDKEIIRVDRDTLPNYAGEEVALVMNGVFREPGFPLPAAVLPLFVGFNAASERVIVQNAEWLRRYEPIGCRDVHTTQLLTSHGIKSDTTGCLTLTLPHREREPASPCVMIVSGGGAGDLPRGLLAHIPPELLTISEFIYHRAPVGTYPLAEEQQDYLEAYEVSLLQQYRDRATLVITPLHHVAAPCIAMGIPVIICRNAIDGRFGHLSEITPIYTPDRFRAIDWQPKQVRIREVQERLLERLATLVGEAKEAHRLGRHFGTR